MSPARRNYRIVRALVLAATVALPAFAADAPLAADVAPAIVASVRALLSEGDRAWDKGDFGQALDRFTRAAALLDTPPIGVRRAECLERLGRLVEASEAYAHVGRMTASPKAPKAYHDAVRDAMRRHGPLAERLARLRIEVPPGIRAVNLNGRPIPRALWGVAMPVDPGEHVIDWDGVQAVVQMRERDSRDVAPPVSPQPSASASARSAPGAAPSQTVPTPSTSAVSVHRTAGWVTFAVGAAAFATSVGLYVAALAKKGDLESRCGGLVCPTSFRSDVEGYDSLRSATAITSVAGLLLVGAGIVLVVTSPSREGSGIGPHKNLWASLGPSGVSLSGRF